MVWEVEFTDQFEDWWNTSTADQQEALTDKITLLREVGPALGRPSVDTVSESRHANMKELRASTMRVLFAFDPRRFGVLLLGGDKRDEWNAWYEAAIPQADDLYDEHLQVLRDEGLIENA